MPKGLLLMMTDIDPADHRISEVKSSSPRPCATGRQGA
jgi:hypothetical protein